MTEDRHPDRRTRRRRAAWFFGLWLASLAAFALVVYGVRALLEPLMR